MAVQTRTGGGDGHAAGEPRPPGRGSRAATGPKNHPWRAAAAFAAQARAIAREAGERLARADRAAIAALPARRNPRGVAVARTVSAVAEPAFAGPLVAAAAVIAARRRGWRAAGQPALAVPGGVLARWLLSEVIARPRPPAGAWLADPAGYSLPSRHATLAALTAGAFAAAADVGGPPRHAIPFLVAAGVGSSRVYLGVHWPTDVLAGWLFAAAWLGLAERAVPGLAPARPSGRTAARAAPGRRG